MPPEIFSAYNPPDDPGIDNDEPTLTQQHFLEECDINVIMARVGMGQALPDKPVEYYGDFSDSSDYHAQLNKLKAAEAEFMALPAKVRDRFNHNPAELLDFLSNKENQQQAIELGLSPAPAPEPPPVKVVVIPEGQPA